MAYKILDLMIIKQLILLKKEEYSNRKIADKLALNRNTVNKYINLINGSEFKLEELLELEDYALSDLFPMGDTIEKNRYKALSKNFNHYCVELKNVGCTRLSLWKDYIILQPNGYGMSQFNYHLNQWLKTKNISGKINHHYGENLLVDYTGKKLTVVDRQTGELQEVECFVAILPASHYIFVHATRTQSKEDFIDSINSSLAFYGGVPQAIVPDNLKAAVTKSSKYEPVINKTFKDQGLHYGFVINPARAYKPQDKALVEGAVKIVYQRIFYPLSKQTFFSLSELNQSILERLNTLNLCHMKTYDSSRFRLFNTYEKQHLKPLPEFPYLMKEYRKAKVQKMGYIFLSVDKNYYSVPYRYIGKTVEIQYDKNTLEIYDSNQRICAHQRHFRPGFYTTTKEHLASSHKFYTEWTPEYFKEKVTDIGQSVLELVTAFFSSSNYAETSFKKCLGIINLSKQYPKSRIDKACEIALENKIISYQGVKNILINQMDLNQTDAETTVTEHENIRGNYS